MVHSGVKTCSDDLVLCSGECAVKNTEFKEADHRITRLQSLTALSSHNIVLAEALDPLATSVSCQLSHGSTSGHYLQVTNHQEIS